MTGSKPTSPVRVAPGMRPFTSVPPIEMTSRPADAATPTTRTYACSLTVLATFASASLAFSGYAPVVLVATHDAEPDSFAPTVIVASVSIGPVHEPWLTVPGAPGTVIEPAKPGPHTTVPALADF